MRNGKVKEVGYLFCTKKNNTDTNTNSNTDTDYNNNGLKQFLILFPQLHTA